MLCGVVCIPSSIFQQVVNVWFIILLPSKSFLAAFNFLNLIVHYNYRAPLCMWNIVRFLFCFFVSRLNRNECVCVHFIEFWNVRYLCIIIYCWTTSVWRINIDIAPRKGALSFDINVDRPHLPYWFHCIILYDTKYYTSSKLVIT